MSSDGSEREQPGLWNVEPPSLEVPEAARRNPSRSAGSTAGAGAPRQPQPPATTPPAHATRPELGVPDLWDADRVAAYLGVPKQTLHAWRHSGNGPKGFRVGKHLRWHAQTVLEWTLALERDQ